MEPQLKPGFSVTDKLNPMNYSSSSSGPSFPAQSNITAQTDDDYFGSFPPGYRFRPLDEELVVYYLTKKIYNQDLPPNRIKEVQLYKYDPDTLAANYESNGGENEWYFFTPRERKYPNGKRPDRAAGGGFWKATGKAKSVDFNGKKVGSKTSLVYFRGEQQKGKKTDWIMHEYTVLDAPQRRKTSQDDMKLDDWVLCKIRKNERSNKTENFVPSCPVEPIEVHQQSQNVPSVPIMSGVNHSHGDNHFSYFGISESMENLFYTSFQRAQRNTFFLRGYNNSEPCIGGSELVPINGTTLALYENIINDPIQSLDF